MYNMTAVEWVFDKMLDIAAGNSSLTTQEILDQAKAMEREQMRVTYNQGLMSNFQNFEEYYNSTYKGGEQ